MEFLRSFLRRHLAGKPVVASPNVGCFLGLEHVQKSTITITFIARDSPGLVNRLQNVF